MSDAKIIADFIESNFPELKFKPCVQNSVKNVWGPNDDDWHGFAYLRENQCRGHPAILRLEGDQVVFINQSFAWAPHDTINPFDGFEQYGVIDAFSHLRLPLSNPDILDVVKRLLQICIPQWKEQHGKSCKRRSKRRKSK